MLSSAYFCVPAYVKICRAFPVEGRRYGTRLSQPRLKPFVHQLSRQLFKPFSLLGGWRSFLVANAPRKPRYPAQPTAGAASVPQKPSCTPEWGRDGSPSPDPARGKLLPGGCSTAWNQGAAVKTGGG